MLSQRQQKREGKTKRKKDREHRKKASHTRASHAANAALRGKNKAGAPLGGGAAGAAGRLYLKRGEKEVIFDVLDSLDRLQARRDATTDGAATGARAAAAAAAAAAATTASGNQKAPTAAAAPQADAVRNPALPETKVWTTKDVRKLEKRRNKQERSLAKEIKADKKAAQASAKVKARAARRAVDPASKNVRVELTTVHKSGEKKTVVVPRGADLKDLLKTAKGKFNRKPNKLKKPTRAFLVETNAKGEKWVEEMKDTQSMCDGDVIMVTEKDAVPGGFASSADAGVPDDEKCQHDDNKKSKKDKKGKKSKKSKKSKSKNKSQDDQGDAAAAASSSSGDETSPAHVSLAQDDKTSTTVMSKVQRMRRAYKRYCRQDDRQGQSSERPDRSSAVAAEQEFLVARAISMQDSTKFNAMQKVRRSLPCGARRDTILDAINNHSVVVISGETGCGKTTQIPQFILEHAVQSGVGGSCQIICTQPRRISAIGVSTRVAAERDEKIGDVIGYQIRLDRRVSRHTHLTFCTTGILLRRLTGDPDLSGITHIVLDEVHEREILSDFLLILLRDLIRTRRPDLKIVLMSATINADLFAKYFSAEEMLTVTASGDRGGESNMSSSSSSFSSSSSSSSSKRKSKKSPKDQKNRKNKDNGPEQKSASDAAVAPCTPCPCLHIPGRTFPVTRYSLEDIVETLQYRNVPSHHQRRPDASTSIDTRGPRRSPSGASYRDATLRIVDSMDQSRINYDLIARVVENVCNKKFSVHNDGTASTDSSNLPPAKDDDATAILIFMPGLGEITRMCQILRERSDAIGRDGMTALIVPLHGSLTSREQTRVFSRPPAGVRKIVVSTNIAETSVTIDDIVCVIDSGRVKEIQYNETSNCPALVETWVSKASARQRQGRAGRVRPGLCFQMFSQPQHDALLDFQVPEIKRKPLEDLILQIRLLQLDEGTSPTAFLQRAIEAPSISAIDNALSVLREMGALSNDNEGGAEVSSKNELTPLGFHLANLPVGVKLGKLLLFGCLFRCIEPVLTIAAAMSCRSPFMSPQNAREDARRAKLAFAQHQSDLLTIARAFQCWEMVRGRNRGRGESSGSSSSSSSSSSNVRGTGNASAPSPTYKHTRDFCRDYFLNDNGMTMIANMREQFRRQLRGIGFLRPEATGATGSDAGLASPMLSLFGNEELEGECNGNGRDVGILRSVICAALYPNVVCIRRTDTRGYSGNRRNKERYTTRTEEVHVHPGSVNFKGSLKKEAWLVYNEKQMTTRMYMYDTNVVTPYMLFLWGGDVTFSYADEVIRVDNWIEFKSTAEAFTLFKRLRAEIQRTLALRIENPNSDTAAQDERIVIDAVSVLLGSERDAGLLDVGMIGKMRASAPEKKNGGCSNNRTGQKRRKGRREGGQVHEQSFNIDSI